MSTNSFRKPFSQKLFDSNDNRGREAVKAYAKKTGINLIDNVFNEFAVDLLEVEQTDSQTIKIIATYEVEVRNKWKTGPFPYDTVRLPMRKMKFQGSNFCIVNNDETHMVFIPADLLATSGIELAPNIYSEGQLEEFISIKVSDCEMIVLKETKRKKPTKQKIEDDIYG